MYYVVYVLKNRTEDKIYIGYSGDLRQRVKKHKDKNPELLYYEAYKDERDARIRERQLKQRGQSIRYLKQRAKYSLSEN